jgi:hypothetical protein
LILQLSDVSDEEIETHNDITEIWFLLVTIVDGFAVQIPNFRIMKKKDGKFFIY